MAKFFLLCTLLILTSLVDGLLPPMLPSSAQSGRANSSTWLNASSSNAIRMLCGAERYGRPRSYECRSAAIQIPTGIEEKYFDKREAHLQGRIALPVNYVSGEFDFVSANIYANAWLIDHATCIIQLGLVSGFGVGKASLRLLNNVAENVIDHCIVENDEGGVAIIGKRTMQCRTKLQQHP